MRYIGGDQGDQLTREVRAVASGALPSGDPVVVNSDGTVGVISSSVGTAVVFEEANSSYIGSAFDPVLNRVVVAYSVGGNGECVVGTVSGNTISFGTPVVYSSGSSTYYNSVVFDSLNDKIVIAYAGASFYGTAIVGTVSGTSISFGSPTIFQSSTSEYLSATFDSNSNKVVVAWKDSGNSGTGTSIVGTVSGTGISFGSTSVYNAGNTDWVTTTFDSNLNKVVIAYRDIGNSLYGTAIIGTVSGTSISFGSEVVFNSAQVRHNFATFDSNSNKVVIAYRDEGNSSYGTAIVGTVSGTSISFGSEVVYETAASEYISSSFDSNSNKVIIAYNDAGNSDYGTVVVGTVSGTSISFDTPVVFEEGDTRYITTVFDSNENKVAITYADSSNLAYGTSVVYDFLSADRPLTSENFIGFAQSGFPDTGNAVIDSKGAINDKQSGLTPGQAYYVQTDGTLSTTADNPSVFAGTAVAANKIIVEG